MRKIAALVGFFTLTPLLLIFSLSLLLNISSSKKGEVLGESTQGIAYAALPPADTTIQNIIEEEDSKVEIVRQFFAKYSSSLEPYSADIVAAARRYDIDFRLLPAIAMQESTLCKKEIANSHNCWGWGIYGGKVIKFNNYPEAIETITKTLSTKYRDKGLVTPFEIVTLYNPRNTNNWAENVTHIMEELK